MVLWGTVELQCLEESIDVLLDSQPVVLVLDDACQEGLVDAALRLKNFKYVHLKITSPEKYWYGSPS